MKIEVLGAHNTESKHTRCSCLLVDKVLAIDAGGLTSNLTFDEQVNLKAVLITHSHYDHIRDLPTLAINFFLRQRSIEIYSHQEVFDALSQHFLSSPIYAEFHLLPEGEPAVNFRPQSAHQPFKIGEYDILGLPVNHSIPSLGYQVSGPNGRSFFYTGDTRGELWPVWKIISPDVLFIEVTGCNRWLESTKSHGHLTPSLLKEELQSFRIIRGYLPRVIAVHLNSHDEPQIRSELSEISEELGTEIEPAYEGMLVEI